MRIGKLLMALSALALGTEAFKPLPKNIAHSATNKLNKFRQTVNAVSMPSITYDFEAQAKLDAIIEANGPTWMFENYTGPQQPTRQNINGYYISQELGYPAEFQIGWHDTCHKLGENCILVNLDFRMNQAHKGCIDYSICDSASNSFDRYRSCETTKPWRGSGNPCSYAWVYLPQFVTASVSKIACAVLDVPGWKPPSGQLNSYWCFTNGVAPNTDQPFQRRSKAVLGG